MKKIIILFLVPLFALSLNAQSLSFEVNLEPVEINGLGGIQSYAFGQHDNKWLIVGGRLDGLHRRQPWATFDPDGNNNNLMVVDPVAKTTWSASLENLPASIKEQLSSSNMEFIQRDNQLILIGGYAYSETLDDHTTFPYLSVIDLENIIPAIINKTSVQPFIRQIEDSKFAVTGGQLETIGDTFYLVGGQKFEGRYNPMGPNHGPGFIQEYTNEIRPFTIADDGQTISINHLTASHDEMHLHRRDYNLLPMMTNDDEQALMLFSGVFQPTADLPWLYPVLITADNHFPLEDFTQHYNHYHSAKLPIYDSVTKEMHSIFFGGIAQFYEDDGMLVQDNDVPFVKTIATVTRFADGQLIENKLEQEMPGYLGASAEFILSPTVSTYDNGVISMDQLSETPLEVGYIYGGISSQAPNIFWINDGTQSEANNILYKVSLATKSVSTAIKETATPLEVLIYPNPSKQIFRIALELESVKSDIVISVSDSTGKLVCTRTYDQTELKVGKNYLEAKVDKMHPTGIYMLSINNNGITHTQKVVVNE